VTCRRCAAPKCICTVVLYK